ncbi:siderophore-interacting protein [Nonomuraea typhae]|uniref:siderophore-interacting protein n=1 Tax=Nonomuraea typhae TaxID=2603600 RepID=UPI0012FB7167|nr:siderophore-interacting protein [Nonomuraea typhae]
MVEPFRKFDVRVRGLELLSPSFLRVTFTGEDLDLFADNGYDQRIKLIFPIAGHGLDCFPTGPDWFQQWRALPAERCNPMRTYTVRHVRPERREVDVDIVLHGDGGPAARWAGAVRPGDEVALFGPDARFEEEHGGLEFRPPAGTGAILMAGDETAAPAICATLERLPAGTRGEALIEVPHATDFLPLDTPSQVQLTWLAREGGEHGARLVPAVRAAAARLLPEQKPADSFEDIDVDVDELWEVPEEHASGPVYAWLAGEAAVIRTLRRHLVAERGMDKRAVAFMGYWRMGRAENNA